MNSKLRRNIAMKQSPPVANSLYDLYQQLNLPVDLIQLFEGFTIFNLTEVGFQLPYQSKPFRPNYYSFLFVKDGMGAYTIDDYTFQTKPYTIYFTNPSNYRTFSWKAITEVYLLTFDEVFLKKYISKNIFQEFSFLLTEVVTPKVVTLEFYQSIEPIYLNMSQEYRSQSPVKYQVLGHLLAAVLYKIKDYFFRQYNPIDEGNRSSQIVKSFKLLLEKHYQDLYAGVTETVFRVQDYAEDQNLHPNYLSNVIKTKTGKSVSTWIIDKTITEAKSLLQHSSLSIKEITHRLGFSETAHFSNYFKKYVGVSPVQYRK